MPSNLGVIAKAHTQPCKIGDYDPGELPSVLDLYILSYDANKNLRTASNTLKRNLQTYLSEYRMINDSINIKNAYIINIQVNFEIVVNPNFNNSETLTIAITALQDYFDIDNWQINEPINIGDITGRLYNINGVQTVNDLTLTNLFGENSGYSKFKYSFDTATRNNTIYPSLDPSIFELKYPDTDIIGRVTT